MYILTYDVRYCGRSKKVRVCLGSKFQYKCIKFLWFLALWEKHKVVILRGQCGLNRTNVSVQIKHIHNERDSTGVSVWYVY
jgi:hypothetical protein